MMGIQLNRFSEARSLDIWALTVSLNHILAVVWLSDGQLGCILTPSFSVVIVRFFPTKYDL